MKTHYKGIIHLHSKFSYDSIVSVETIARIACEENLDFILLTDHDTIEGSLHLREYIQLKKLAIEVPIAAEYKTEFGDVIAAFIDCEINERRFGPFISEVRNRGGIILLPHPYSHHVNLDELAQASDLIETYNSRISKDLNDKAELLAVQYNKRIFAGSDAHLSADIANVILYVENKGDLKTSLLNGFISTTINRSTKKNNILLSQIIKGFKKRNIKLILYNLFRIIKRIVQR